MLKILGSIWVMGAALVLGIKKYAILSQRRKTLCIIYDGAEKIRSNLKCQCMPLYECFLCGGEFFREAAQAMSRGLLPCEAVMTASESFLMLEDEDCEILRRFAQGLDAQSRDGQLRNIEIFISEVNKKIEKATGELETRGKLYIKGSLLIAAALVLILV